MPEVPSHNPEAQEAQLDNKGFAKEVEKLLAGEIDPATGWFRFGTDAVRRVLDQKSGNRAIETLSLATTDIKTGEKGVVYKAEGEVQAGEGQYKTDVYRRTEFNPDGKIIEVDYDVTPNGSIGAIEASRVVEGQAQMDAMRERLHQSIQSPNKAA